MNFDQFAASFRNPEGAVPCGEQPVQDPVGEVTIAGTVVSIAKDLCCLEINGVQYEIPARDVMEIGDLVPAAVGGSAERPAEEAKKGKKSEVKPDAGPRLVMVKMAANALLYTRVRVPAAMIAAVGTWVTVVPQQPQQQASQAA
jgi:hypothetical protein